jgi:hypothetical protein
MATNTYKVNGETPQTIIAGVADIDMSTETGVRAGCREYPIPLLNKITVTSTEGDLSKSTSIYAGYKVVQHMLGAIVPAGNYKADRPILNTIIENGRFGIFEPGHYNPDTRRWNIHNLSNEQINSLINVGTGIKICVKIEYTKNDTSAATVYVPINGAYNDFKRTDDVSVPSYTELGVLNSNLETAFYSKVDNYDRRAWHESIFTSDVLNINLGSSIANPDITKNMTITLMAYIGSIPTADNTFQIMPMTTGSQTSITVAFENENYNPLINFYNKDERNNPDTYDDGYGSVADYEAGTTDDTTISISIVAPE